MLAAVKISSLAGDTLSKKIEKLGTEGGLQAFLAKAM